MKAFIAFTLLIAGVSANTLRFHEKRLLEEPHFVRAVETFTPVARKHIPILKLTNDIRGAQSNDLKYETGNGISLTENTQSVPGVRSVYEDERGRMIESDSSLVKSGSYSYTSPEGLPISVRYTADEDGFHVEGDHLPKPVELPAELAEAYRVAFARIGHVDPVSPLLIVEDSPAPLRIKTHHRHHHRPATTLRFSDSTHAAFRHL